MKVAFFVLLVALTSAGVFAQCEESLKTAERAFGDNFIVEPHSLQGMIAHGDSLTFHSLWLAGNTYRIATSKTNNQHINIVVFDQNNNTIFDGSGFNYPGSWDFFVEHSLEIRCVVSAHVPDPICVTVLSGFKK
jgi:hypothetical protein